MVTEFRHSSHPEDDTLERFCMGRLDEQHLAPVEEHLLVCDRCRDWVSEHESFLTAARAAAQEVRQEEKYRKKAAPRFSWVAQPKWLGLAAVAAGLIVAIPMFRTPATETVQLSAYRGETTVGGAAAAGHPLDLKVDLKGMPAGDCCRIEIADSSGRIVAQGEATPHDEVADFRAPELRPGQYWVRVKSRSGAALRETGLTVR